MFRPFAHKHTDNQNGKFVFSTFICLSIKIAHNRINAIQNPHFFLIFGLLTKPKFAKFNYISYEVDNRQFPHWISAHRLSCIQAFGICERPEYVWVLPLFFSSKKKKKKENTHTTFVYAHIIICMETSIVIWQCCLYAIFRVKENKLIIEWMSERTTDRNRMFQCVNVFDCSNG